MATSARPGWQTDDLAEEWVEAESENFDDQDNLSYGTRSISLTTPLASHIQNLEDDDLTHDLPTSSQLVGTFHVRDDVQHAPIFPKTPGKGKIQTFFTPSKLETMFEPPTPPMPPLPTIPDASPPDAPPPGNNDVVITSPSTPNGAPQGPFTFSMPRTAGPSLIPGFGPDAESTPHPPSGATSNPQAPDTPLRLFQFNYDTYTRDHLSALVDSIAAHSPGTGTVSSKPSSSRPLSRVSETSNSHLRSTKRVKLSPREDIYGEGAGHRATIARPLNGKEYVNASQSLMQQIRKKAMDTSTMSSVMSSRRLESSPQSSSSLSTSPVVQPKAPNLLAVPKPQLSSYSSSLSGTTRPSSTASTYRQRGADLLAQIRSDMKGQKRIFSGDSDLASVTTAHSEDKENHKQTSFRHRRSSSVRSNQSSRSNATRRSPRPRPAIPAFHDAAPVTSVFAMTAATDFNHLVPQPLFMPPGRAQGQQRSSDLGPPTHPSGRPHEDLNRYVSSSTASGTTLTTGTATSYVKHAGPAQIRTIAPGDVPELPHKLGGMMFDKVLMRWVKSTMQPNQEQTEEAEAEDDESEDPFGDIESLKDETQQRRNSAQSAQVQEEVIAELRRSHSGSESETTPTGLGEHVPSETEGEEEEMELTSFSTDAQSLRVVPVMTGDQTTDSESEVDPGDEEGIEVFAPRNDGFDSTFSDDDGFEHNLHFQEELEDSPSESSRASSPTPQAIEPPRSPSPVAATPRRDTPNDAPATPAIRSALKNNGTPHPSAASRSEHRTPRNLPRHRRSVSFSDGKREGPIQGLSRREDGDDVSFAPSARTRRIADMMNALEDDSDFSDDSPSKASGADRPTEIRPLTERRLEEINATKDESSSQLQSRSRRLSRSQTFRSSTGPGNATFLTECSFGVAHDRLVEVITDVQPFEPHWEELSVIDLSDKKIESVARLKEFLPRLDGLSLNRNQISWLSGVPKTVRTLSVAANELTEVTSFSHLLKLESLDISNNNLDSLSQLSCLRKLRELRVDGNKIRSLEGLESMRHLVKLSVEGNKLSGSVDVGQCHWPQLEVLNLAGNRIEEVAGLHMLRELVILNLDNNAIPRLALAGSLPRLRILRLSGNKLSDVATILDGRLPNLRTLYADENRLPLFGNGSTSRRNGKMGSVSGIGKIECLSLRNQKRDKAKGRDDSGPLLTHDVRDVKRLYLSGNTLPSKTALLAKPAYNLVYLELAGCRLTSSPFTVHLLGSIAPNIRVLNLNYNFLDDAGLVSLVSGGSGKESTRLERLRKFSVIGSRIERVKSIVQCLEALAGDEIEMVDFRMNPCTLGWYLPVFVPGGSGRSTNSPMMQESSGEYRKLDTNFRRSLPDSSYVGRLAYRGLIMRICGESLREIDGVPVAEKERVKADKVLARVGQ